MRSDQRCRFVDAEIRRVPAILSDLPHHLANPQGFEKPRPSQPILHWINFSRSCRVTERLRLLAIRLGCDGAPCVAVPCSVISTRFPSQRTATPFSTPGTPTQRITRTPSAQTIRFESRDHPPLAIILSDVVCTAARSRGGDLDVVLKGSGTPFDDQIRGFCRARATNNLTRQSEGTTSRRDAKEAGPPKIRFAFAPDP